MTDFDAHAHPGASTENAFIATASSDEAGKLTGYRYKALGAIAEGREHSLRNLENAAEAGFHIGEIGIDSRYPDMEGQMAFFRDALTIAKDYDRIAVIHTVRAYEMTYKTLRTSGISRFIMHGYTGSYEMAKQFISLGGMISIGRRAMRAKSFSKLITLPFLTESDMHAGYEQEMEIRNWNRELSELLGKDISERTWEMLSEWL